MLLQRGQQQQQQQQQRRRLRTCAVRPLGMYGEGDPYHLGKNMAVARDLGAAHVVCLGSGAAQFQHVYAGNVAHAHACALHTLLGGRGAAAAAAAGGQAFFATDGTEVCNFFDFFVPYWRCVIRSLLT